MKAGFLDKLLTKLDRVPAGEMQAFLMRLVREKGFFEQVFEALEEGVIICDPQGVISFINRAACRFFGLEGTDPAGKHIEDAIRGFHWPARRNLRDTISRDMEVFYPEHRFLNFYLRPIDDGELDAPQLGSVMLVRDLTQTRKMAEEQIESERLNALTMMAAGVAHEIGNPLNSLNIHLQLLERKLKKADADIYGQVKEQINVARSEIQRLDFIIEQFLRAIRPAKPVFELADLNKVIESAVNFLAPELNDRRIKTRLQLHDSLPLLRLDPNQLKQAFYNLIKNAVQAMGTGGSLTIRSDLSEYDAVVTFEDTGRGMSPETVAAMHEAWFTTRKTGVGLGMLIVRRIMREHGGELRIDSSEGKGTRITLTLPRGPRPVRFLEAGSPDERKKPAEPEVIDV
jgi:two-component system, sporulation sensor kinase E